MLKRVTLTDPLTTEMKSMFVLVGIIEDITAISTIFGSEKEEIETEARLGLRFIDVAESIPQLVWSAKVSFPID